MNNRWGITKFLDLKTFKNPSKGYLIKDSCVFGAEVFIIKDTCIEECLTVISEPELSCKYTWKIDNFSRKIVDDQCFKSDTFIGGDYKWYVYMYIYIYICIHSDIYR